MTEPGPRPPIGDTKIRFGAQALEDHSLPIAFGRAGRLYQARLRVDGEVIDGSGPSQIQALEDATTNLMWEFKLTRERLEDANA